MLNWMTWVKYNMSFISFIHQVSVAWKNVLKCRVFLSQWPLSKKYATYFRKCFCCIYTGTLNVKIVQCRFFPSVFLTVNFKVHNFMLFVFESSRYMKGFIGQVLTSWLNVLIHVFNIKHKNISNTKIYIYI